VQFFDGQLQPIGGMRIIGRRRESDRHPIKMIEGNREV